MIDISKKLTETLTVARVTARSTTGDQTRGDVFTCAAKIERQTVEVSAGSTESVSIGATIFTLVGLRTGDLVFFPEDNPADDNTGHTVLNSSKHVSLDGTINHYTATV